MQESVGKPIDKSIAIDWTYPHLGCHALASNNCTELGRLAASSKPAAFDVSPLSSTFGLAKGETPFLWKINLDGLDIMVQTEQLP